MTTAGDNITKANITASAETLKGYNSGIVWHSGNQPFQTDITGGDASGEANQNYANEVGDTDVTAATLVTNFRAYAYFLSTIRNVRLQKWFQIQGDVRARLDYDDTQMTNLNTNYATDTAVVSGMVAGDVISASSLDDFVNRLSTTINNNRTNTVLIEEFYCHSNCHGSCHGSL
jgi:hypothetical protein